MKKVFNVGFSKTGTTSFEVALKLLGYNAYRGDFRVPVSEYAVGMWIHRDYAELRRLSTYWDAFADAPWGGTDLYRQLVEWYPDAKFVLTVRDPEAWYCSLEKMLTECSDGDLATAIETFHANGRYAFAHFFEHRFGVKTLVGARERVIEEYVRHNEEAEAFLGTCGVDFLRFHAVGDEGWETLCPFLEQPIPETPYPHVNLADRPRAPLTVEVEREMEPEAEAKIEPEFDADVEFEIVSEGSPTVGG